MNRLTRLLADLRTLWPQDPDNPEKKVLFQFAGLSITAKHPWTALGVVLLLLLLLGAVS